MVKIFAVLFITFALASIADSKPISNEESPSASSSVPCIDCVGNPTVHRPKRQAVDILGAVGGMVTNIIHEAMVHKKQQAPPPYYPDRYEYIGNGRDNTNNITYNIYPDRYNNPNPNPYRSYNRNPFGNYDRNSYPNYK